MSCSSSSRLLLPRCAPASGVFAAVERDTRALALSDAERFNYYPATPLAVVSWIFEGALHPVQMVGTATGEPALSAPLPRLTLAGPQRRPRASWAPGPVHALSVAFRPEDLARLTGVRGTALMDGIAPWPRLRRAHSWTPACPFSKVPMPGRSRAWKTRWRRYGAMRARPRPRPSSVSGCADWRAGRCCQALARACGRSSGASRPGPARVIAICNGIRGSRMRWRACPRIAGTAESTGPGWPAARASPTSRTWAAKCAA